MRFHQHREPVAQQEVAGGEARRVDAVDEAGLRVVVFGQRGIERQRQRALGREVGHHPVAELAADRAQRIVAGVQRLDLDRDVVFELRPVGGMQVHLHQRVPGVDQPQHRLHLRRIGLGVVAIEVEVLRGGAPARLARAALVGPVPRFEALVAVDVEHRHEQPHQPLQAVGRDGAVQHLAQQQEPGVLAVGLAGVDAALDQHHRVAALARPRGIQRTGAGDGERLHRPAFGTGAEIKAAHRVRTGTGERIAQRDDFVVAPGLGEAAALGVGGQRLRRLRGHRGGARQRQQQGGEEKGRGLGVGHQPGLRETSRE